MKRIFALLLALMTVFSLCACTPIAPPPETTPLPETTATAPEITAPTETLPTQPAHSPLYIPDVPVEDVITYFNEVCLDSEIILGGDPSVVQKWVIPIYYTIEGEYTDTDIAVLNGFADWLNSVEGFPGISQITENCNANLRIHFCDQQKMLDLMGENFAGMDGGVTFWYTDDQINDAIICYRTDIDQYVRNSVIIEEIYNGLGPIQDTALREDSIIFQGYSTPQQLTAMDELIIRLLYHPDIKPGMNTQQCEQIIRTLYY